MCLDCGETHQLTCDASGLYQLCSLAGGEQLFTDKITSFSNKKQLKAKLKQVKEEAEKSTKMSYDLTINGKVKV